MANVETAAAVQNPRRLTVPREQRLGLSGFIGFLMPSSPLAPVQTLR
jgi:hypothetical protein